MVNLDGNRCNDCIFKNICRWIITYHLLFHHVKKESVLGYMLKEHIKLLLRKNEENDSTEIVICNEECLSQKLNVISVSLLVSSERLIIELLNQRLNMYSVSLLISYEKLIVELLNQRLNIYNVLPLISSEKLIVKLQSLQLSKHSVLQLVNSEMLFTELQNLMLNEKTVYVVIESVLLHIGTCTVNCVIATTARP